MSDKVLSYSAVKIRKNRTQGVKRVCKHNVMFITPFNTPFAAANAIGFLHQSCVRSENFEFSLASGEPANLRR